MMVTVTASKQTPGGQWVGEKIVECSERDAPGYVKMFFDMGYTKVRVQ